MLYHLPTFTTIHGILFVHFTCSTVYALYQNYYYYFLSAAGRCRFKPHDYDHLLRGVHSVCLEILSMGTW